MVARSSLTALRTDPILALVLVIGTLLTGWVVVSRADTDLQFAVALTWFGLGSTLMLLRRPR